MKTKTLNMDIIVSPELGAIIILVGMILVVYGYKQGKKEFDIDKIPLIRPVLKELIGAFLIIFGFIQIIPVIIS